MQSSGWVNGLKKTELLGSVKGSFEIHGHEIRQRTISKALLLSSQVQLHV